LRWSIEDTGNYVFNSEIGLRIPIIERMQASVQFNIDRNNSPAPDTKKNDYETLITGGYSW
jgi:putative salt-induced outer membrane protein YdiY